MGVPQELDGLFHGKSEHGGFRVPFLVAIFSETSMSTVPITLSTIVDDGIYKVVPPSLKLGYNPH